MNRRILNVLGFAVAVFLVQRSASAESERVIDAARIRLGDLVTSAPEGAADADLGPAPPPGGSRLVSKQEILRQLRELGQDGSNLALPPAIRVTRAANRLSAEELKGLVTPAIARSLPAGTTLGAVTVRSGAVLSRRASVGHVTFPKLPKREGSFKTTAMVELVTDGEVAMRLPVSVTLDLKPEAAKSLLERGAQVNLLIERGPARVTAVGFALREGDVGEVVQFKVQNTQKILRARIESRTLARVVGN